MKYLFISCVNQWISQQCFCSCGSIEPFNANLIYFNTQICSSGKSTMSKSWPQTAVAVTSSMVGTSLLVIPIIYTKIGIIPNIIGAVQIRLDRLSCVLWWLLWLCSLPRWCQAAIECSPILCTHTWVRSGAKVWTRSSLSKCLWCAASYFYLVQT